jgi:hypothetical protein
MSGYTQHDLIEDVLSVDALLSDIFGSVLSVSSFGRRNACAVQYRGLARSRK